MICSNFAASNIPLNPLPNLFDAPQLRHVLQIFFHFNLFPPTKLPISGGLPNPLFIRPNGKGRVLRFPLLSYKNKKKV